MSHIVFTRSKYDEKFREIHLPRKFASFLYNFRSYSPQDALSIALARLSSPNPANSCSMSGRINHYDFTAMEPRGSKMTVHDKKRINAMNLEAGILLSERKKINAISAKNDAEDRATLLLQNSATMASLPTQLSSPPNHHHLSDNPFT